MAVGALERICFDAEFEGHPWLARLARGTQRAAAARDRAARLAVVHATTSCWPSASGTSDAGVEALLQLAFGLACASQAGTRHGVRPCARRRRCSGSLDAAVLAWWVDPARASAQGRPPGR